MWAAAVENPTTPNIHAQYDERHVGDRTDKTYRQSMLAPESFAKDERVLSACRHDQ